MKTSLTTTGTEQAQLVQEAELQRERALEAFRGAPISGRLLIRLHPGLRDGDRLEIPKQPGIVPVIKHVYYGNSITYVSGNNAGWYLSEGGVTRLAEEGAILIVGAIGEVISCRQGGWWSGNALSTAAHPGDTVVTPT